MTIAKSGDEKRPVAPQYDNAYAVLELLGLLDVSIELAVDKALEDSQEEADREALIEDLKKRVRKRLQSL